MEGVATLPPVFYEHLIPKQVQQHFTSKFDRPPNSTKKMVISKLSTAFMSHETPYALKAVPKTTTGSQVQVTAVYMLEFSRPDIHCLPAVCFVTPMQNLSDRRELEKDTTILVDMAHYKEGIEQYVKLNSLTRPSSVAMGLDPEKYHYKLIEDFFPVLAFKYTSLTRMLEVTSPFAGTSYTSLPLAVRLKDKQFSCDTIIFEKLVGYLHWSSKGA